MKGRREREQQLDGGVQRMDRNSAGKGYIHSHGAQSPSISQTPLGFKSPNLGHQPISFDCIQTDQKKIMCLPTSCPNTKHICCVLPYCAGRVEKKRGTWRVRCPHDVTNNGKDQGLSSPRFHSEICGYSKAVIHDMLPLLIDLK